MLTHTDRRKIYRNTDTTALINFSDESMRHDIDEKIKKYRPKNLVASTPAVQKFSDNLNKLGIRYKREVFIPTYDTVYFADFLIGKPYYFLVEIDGGIHKKQKSYDSKRDNEIMSLTGWFILRFTNEEVLSDDKEMFSMFVGTLLSIARVEFVGHKTDFMQTLSMFRKFLNKHHPDLIGKLGLHDSLKDLMIKE